MKGNVSAIASKDNCMLPNLWQMWQHECAHSEVQTWFDEFGVEEFQWPAQSPELTQPH